jgi:ATP/maltotriose-dependent transcriptional regulator MalT/DNA-binding SARP family transcriptional activator
LIKVSASASPKVTRPRLSGIVARERLFAQISRSSTPILWISAPPGAGKTTLAASYIEATKPSTLWYQVDSADADPATLFYYLREAAAQGGLAKTRALPLLPAESVADLASFTRRYFRELFAKMPRPALLTIDNFQDADGPAFETMIREAFAQVPDGVTVLVLSLTDPPAALARLVANRLIGMIGADELRFTRSESDQVVSSRLAIDEDALAALHERSGGWAAGLVLMTEHMRRAGPSDDASLAESQEAVFDYFAGEILSRAAPEDQRALMLTASLPRVTSALMEAMSGHSGGSRLLAHLYQRHMFIDRRHGAEPIYQYHGLFRAFLRTRARERLATSELVESAERAALLFEIEGHIDDAVTMHLAASDWNAASRLIVQHARNLYQQGRWRTLLDWIAALPPGAFDADPWLAYWVGACQVWVNPTIARRMLAQAYERFSAQKDLGGRVLAAGAMTRACILDVDWSVLDQWIESLETLLQHDTGAVSPRILLTGYSRLIYAMLARQPRHPRLPEWADRTLLAAGADVEPSETVLAGFSLLTYFNWTGQTAKQEEVIRQIEPLLDDVRLSPVSLAYWKWAHANHVLRTGSPGGALALIDRGLELAVNNGLTIAGIIRRHRIAHLLTLGRLDDAHSELDQLATAPRIEPYFEMRAWLALQRGELAAAQDEARTALRMATERGRSYYQILDQYLLAVICAEAESYGEALEHARIYRELTAGVDGQLAQFQALLVEAYVALRQHDRGTGHPLLHRALEIGSQQRYRSCWAWHPSMMVCLLTEALDHDIGVTYARELIRIHRLLPESHDAEHWPWPVRIYTLGRFEIQIDGMPLRFAGKAQRKPLELLKAMIALGAYEVAVDKLIDTLWPDPARGDGQKTFDITVHRLRKLLRFDAAFEVSDRRASLNRHIVWVDAWALDRTLESLVPVATAVLPRIDLLEAAAPQVLRLYRGPFLAEDAEAPWQIAARNRLTGRFHRFVLRLGEHWERGAQWTRASELYQHAIELDPLAESFYRRQMICMQAEGRRAEALEVFRRCRQILSVTLGILPAQETETVHRQLLAS